MQGSSCHDENHTFQQGAGGAAEAGAESAAVDTGTRFFCEVQGESVVLTPEHPQRLAREHVIDPLTGLRVTRASADTEPVTTEIVNVLLEEFP